jgi:pSer/pThr/pTyr-binding forkhead associated (FHA) protein
VELPATTMPFMDQEEIGTIQSKSGSGGFLSGEKRYAIVVLEGEKRGHTFPIDKPHVTIGRMQSDINLNDSEVSRQHALITIHGTEARLEDLGSTNGTYVGDSRVQQANLEDKSEFRVGNHQLMFVVSDRGDDVVSS